MIGLFVLGMLGLWAWFAIWTAGKLSKYFWHNANAQPIATIGLPLTTLIVTVLVILLPFWDQIIAYPKWQQLCTTTGDFEWGPGMDEKKAFGREVTTKFEQHQTTIFPNIEVEYSSKSIFDAKTQELIFKKPHYAYSARAFMYLPSGSGDKSAPFLTSCENFKFMHKNDSLHKLLQLTEVKNQGK